MNKELVARNLLRQRTSRGLTQEQLAEQSGVTARTIQRIEAAGATPHLTTLALLAGALDIPVQELAQGPDLAAASVPIEQPAGPRTEADAGRLALLHLLPLLGLLLPLANLLAPVGYWLYTRGADARFDAQGRAVINFQLTATLIIYLGVGGLLLYFPVGAALLALGYGLVLIMGIVNARRAAQHQHVHYPLALPVLGQAPAVADA